MDKALLDRASRLYLYTKTRVEAFEVATIQQGHTLEEEIQQNLRSMFRDCEKLEMALVNMSPNYPQPFKIAVDELHKDCKQLQATFKCIRADRQARERAAIREEELLRRRFAISDEEDTSRMITAALRQRRQQDPNRGHGDLVIGMGTDGTPASPSGDRGSSPVAWMLRNLRTFARTAYRRGMNMIRTIRRNVAHGRVMFLGGLLLACLVAFSIRKMYLG